MKRQGIEAMERQDIENNKSLTKSCNEETKTEKNRS